MEPFKTNGIFSLDLAESIRSLHSHNNGPLCNYNYFLLIQDGVNCESNIKNIRLQLPVIVTLIICVSISACNQEGCTDILAVNYSNNATIENGSCIYPFYAGAIEHGGVILELENPLEMSFVWDEESLYGFAELFLDLDADGNPDLNFSATTYNNDSLESIQQSGIPEYFNHLQVSPMNGYEILFNSINYYYGGGGTGVKDFVHPFMEGDRIDHLGDWSNLSLPMYHENISEIIPFGPWYGITGVLYLSFRLDEKLGWIKCDMHNGLPTIHSIGFIQ